MRCLYKYSLFLLLTVMPVFLLNSCFNQRVFFPELTTVEITSITQFTAISGGEVIDDGGASILERGVCWNTSGAPTKNQDRTIEDGETGSFVSNLTDLIPNTTYYVRAYATNKELTGYGNEITFTTITNTIKDIDGNVYNTVEIGTQKWMAENLKTTKYNDNTPIPQVTDNSQWAALTADAFCWHSNEIGNKDVYGGLYNWFTASSNKICPAGWHVPTDEDFKILEQNLGLTTEQADIVGWRGTDQGVRMKSQSGWINNGNGTNTTGFNAVPAGARNNDGNFNSTGYNGVFWTSTSGSAVGGLVRELYYSHNDVRRANFYKQIGCSIRCIKD